MFCEYPCRIYACPGAAFRRHELSNTPRIHSRQIICRHLSSVYLACASWAHNGTRIRCRRAQSLPMRRIKTAAMRARMPLEKPTTCSTAVEPSPMTAIKLADNRYRSRLAFRQNRTSKEKSAVYRHIEGGKKIVELRAYTFKGFGNSRHATHLRARTSDRFFR